ncbi:MAG: DUF1566 domain-containing protein [bacterium]|nr:DUF1566 domain-containing protein [bacterium]
MADIKHPKNIRPKIKKCTTPKNYSFFLFKNLIRNGLVVLISVLAIFAIVKAGSLNPSSNPAATFFTLENIYSRLTTNATSTEGDHVFTPGANPAGSLYTLEQIYGAIPTILPDTVKLDTSYLGIDGTLVPSGGTATTTDVCSAKTYFGANQSNWTLAIGALSIDASKILTSATYCGITGSIATRTLDNSTTTVSAGYYATTTLEAIDADLIADNILSGITIFGINGIASSGGASLVDTGQTGCWDGSGNPITCGESPVGQDAEYTSANSAHTCDPSYAASTISGDTVVTDNCTGLMWKQCSEGQTGSDCTGDSALYYIWTEALAQCEGLTYAGSGDWRLPNMKELVSIANYQNVYPAIDTAYFPNTQSDYYWSSTTYAAYPYGAWIVNFNGGYVYNDNKDYGNYVRCVRQ